MSARKSQTSVYIVDDHPVFRHGLRQIIQSDESFAVVGGAGDDTTALAEIPELKPQIIILDVRLPQKGGLELVRSLRKLLPQAAHIMLTMHEEESTFNAAMDAGALGYI